MIIKGDVCVLCVYEIKEKLKPSHKRCLSIVVRRLYFIICSELD